MKTVLWIRVKSDGTTARKMEVFPFGDGTAVSCWDGRIVWNYAGGWVWIDGYDAYFQFKTHAEHGPFVGWTPVNVADERVLWRSQDERISLWKIDAAGNQVSYREHGPFGGWTAVNYADDRVLWRHTDGQISLWAVDAAGNQVSYREHGPFGGWTAVNYADGMILWRHTDGRASVWVVDDQGRQVSYKEHALPGFVPESLRDGWLLWRSAEGEAVGWRLDEAAAKSGQIRLGRLDPRISVVVIEDEVSLLAEGITTVLAPKTSPPEMATWTILGVMQSTGTVMIDGTKRASGVSTTVQVFNPSNGPVQVGTWLFATDGTPVVPVYAQDASVYAPGWWTVGAKATARFTPAEGFSGTMVIRTIATATVGAESLDEDTKTRRTLTVQKA